LNPQGLVPVLEADGVVLSAWIARWVTAGFTALEALIAQHGGAFAFGDAPTLADCHLVPQVYSARRFEVDLEGFPHIRRVEAAAAALAAFAAAHPNAQADAEPGQG
jgi:maleylpyruvate isomerase